MTALIVLAFAGLDADGGVAEASETLAALKAELSSMRVRDSLRRCPCGVGSTRPSACSLPTSCDVY